MRGTPMQQLLTQLKNERVNLPMDIEWDRCYQAVEMVIQNTYLPMEKEQQEYFFNCGRQYQLTGEGTFTQVHSETYKQNEI